MHGVCVKIAPVSIQQKVKRDFRLQKIKHKKMSKKQFLNFCILEIKKVDMKRFFKIEQVQSLSIKTKNRKSKVIHYHRIWPAAKKLQGTTQIYKVCTKLQNRHVYKNKVYLCKVCEL